MKVDEAKTSRIDRASSLSPTQEQSARCTVSCGINRQVGGDHAYCECDCHPDLAAIPPSRRRRQETGEGE